MSDVYKVGYTLRFPRVVMIRHDLPWWQCKSYQNIIDLNKKASGKLTNSHCIRGNPSIKKKFEFLRFEIKYFFLDDDEPAAKRSRGGSIPTTAAHYLPADVTDVIRSSKCFKGKEICVYNGVDGGPNKQELEKLIHSGGGGFVQNRGTARR